MSICSSTSVSLFLLVKGILRVGFIDVWEEKRMDVETIADQQQWEVITPLLSNDNIGLKQQKETWVSQRLSGSGPPRGLLCRSCMSWRNIPALWDTLPSREGSEKKCPDVFLLCLQFPASTIPCLNPAGNQLVRSPAHIAHSSHFLCHKEEQKWGRTECRDREQPTQPQRLNSKDNSWMDFVKMN